MALGCRQLLEVERAFRTLKTTTLELRPLCHRLAQRIEAHVLLCWLALLLVRVIERETGDTWLRLRDLVEEIAQVDLRGKDGAIRITSNLRDEHRKLFKRLKIDPPRRLCRAVPSASPA